MDKTSNTTVIGGRPWELLKSNDILSQDQKSLSETFSKESTNDFMPKFARVTEGDVMQNSSISSSDRKQPNVRESIDKYVDYSSPRFGPVKFQNLHHGSASRPTANILQEKLTESSVRVGFFSLKLPQNKRRRLPEIVEAYDEQNLLAKHRKQSMEDSNIAPPTTTTRIDSKVKQQISKRGFKQGKNVVNSVTKRNKDSKKKKTSHTKRVTKYAAADSLVLNRPQRKTT